MNPLALVTAIPVKAAEPSLQDNTADLDRLKAALFLSLPARVAGYRLHIPFRSMATVASAFRKASFKGYAIVTVLVGQLDIIDFMATEPEVLPAMALDLGSTHLEATLIDLMTGTTLAHNHAVNLQVEYGADILSRIHFAVKNNEDAGGEPGLLTLQRVICTTINGLIAELSSAAGLVPEQVLAISISGNTTMVHLLLGLNPYYICREPYIPLVNDPDPFPAREIGLTIHAQAMTWVLPSIGSYFGGDLISGILAADFDRSDQICMLIDVGTNAEVVVGNSEWLIACAGAAGPALEGGVARMGMRAGTGAVDHVSIDRENWQLSWQTIDDAMPKGICGSGLIDLVAELYLAQIVDLRGKFQPAFTGQSKAQQRFVGERLVERDNELSFTVAFAEEAANGEPVLLSQIDLDAMMRSKAAMYAILVTLTSQVGVAFDELDRIYVAGAFGKHIDPRQAITLGMLPDLPLDTYQPVGNSSLHGAELILMDEVARERAWDIGRKITYVELNVNQEFMIRFSGSRFIPHTDPEQFPSVPVFR